MKDADVRAIRWVSFFHNFNCGPEDVNVDSLSITDILRWEQTPNREVSVEILPNSSRHTYCIVYGAIGLEVDIERTTLVRAYSKDANTIPESGKLIPDEREHVTTDSWKECRNIYDSVPKNKRQGWSEGVVASPVYKAIVVRTDDDELDDGLVDAMKEFFQLPIRKVRSRSFNMDD